MSSRKILAMDNYPSRVSEEHRPDRTPENIPDDVLEAAISVATEYGTCPHCGEAQFYPVMAGHNTTWECRECGDEMRIVG